MGPPKITLKFAISKFVSHRNRIPRQFCLHAFFTENFAGNIFRHEFRRQIFFAGTNFSPAPFFRQRRFSPAAFFAALTLHAALKNNNSVLLLLFKRQAKQPQATSMRPVVTGENSHFYSFIMTSTIILACQPPIPTSKFCSLNFLPVFRSAGWLP